MKIPRLPPKSKIVVFQGFWCITSKNIKIITSCNKVYVYICNMKKLVDIPDDLSKMMDVHKLVKKETHAHFIRRAITELLHKEWNNKMDLTKDILDG